MHSPKFMNNEGTLIHLTVDANTAVVVEPIHWPDLFRAALEGAYGEVAAYVPAANDAPVSTALTCSRLQAKAALLQRGLLSQVEAAVAAMDPLTQLAWGEASEYRRSSPLLNALADYITWPDGSSLTQNDIDQLFSIAQSIEV